MFEFPEFSLSSSLSLFLSLCFSVRLCLFLFLCLSLSLSQSLSLSLYLSLSISLVGWSNEEIDNGLVLSGDGVLCKNFKISLRRRLVYHRKRYIYRRTVCVLYLYYGERAACVHR